METLTYPAVHPSFRALVLLAMGSWLLGLARLPAAATPVAPAPAPFGMVRESSTLPRATAPAGVPDRPPFPQGPAFRQAPEAIVHLVSPAPGEAWRAGTSTEIAWEPLAAMSGLGHVEEWEAFLSLDGGAHYSVRLTPHLDTDLRRARIQVPDTPTAGARLMLRFGDERREETWIQLARPLIIAAAGDPAGAAKGAAPAASGAALARLTAFAATAARASLLGAASAGEPALPGRPGVAAWQEGTRRGTATRQMVAAPLAVLGPQAPALSSGGAAPVLAEAAPDEAALASPRPATAGAGPPRTSPPIQFRPDASLPPADILTQTGRRNE